MSGIIIALGGAPLGFFLSQSWYFFQWPISHDGIGGIGRSPLGRYVDTLRIRNRPIRWNRRKLVVDYLVVHCANKKESGYISRRWDLLNLFGSEITVIVEGYVIILFLGLVDPKFLPTLPLLALPFIIMALAILTFSLSFIMIKREQALFIVQVLRQCHCAQTLLDSFPDDYV